MHICVYAHLCRHNGFAFRLVKRKDFSSFHFGFSMNSVLPSSTIVFDFEQLINMCGSVAIVALEQNRPSFSTKPISDLSSRLENALLTIQHRGPDSQGQWISPDGRVGTRLFSTNLK